MDFFSTILAGVVALSGFFVIAVGVMLLAAYFPVPLLLGIYTGLAVLYTLIN